MIPGVPSRWIGQPTTMLADGMFPAQFAEPQNVLAAIGPRQRAQRAGGQTGFIGER